MGIFGKLQGTEMSKLQLKATSASCLLPCGSAAPGHPGKDLVDTQDVLGTLEGLVRVFVLVILKAGSSPVQLEGDFFYDASVHIVL